MNAARKTISSTLPNSDAWKENTEIVIERVDPVPEIECPRPITSRIAPIRIT